MTSEQELKRRKMLEIMANSIKGNAAPLGVPTGKSDAVPPAGLPPPVNINTANLPQPIAESGPTEPAPMNVRVGYSTKGLTGLPQKVAELRDLETADPSSKVTAEGIEPPKKMGRWEGAGLGALGGVNAGGQATGNDPYGQLAGAITGAIFGGGKPRLVQKVLRDQEIAHKRQDIGQDVKLEGEQAGINLKNAQAERELGRDDIEQAKLDIQDKVEQGRMDRDEANRQLEHLRQLEVERHNQEMERQGQARIDKPPVLRPTKPDTSGAESAARYKKAEGYWAEALAKEAEAAGLPTDTIEGQDRRKQLLEESADLKRRTRTLQEQGDALKAKAPASTGPKWSASRWAAANKGGDVEAAKRAAAAKGYQVTE